MCFHCRCLLRVFFFNARRIDAHSNNYRDSTISKTVQLARINFGILNFLPKKKQNEKISHENEAKNRRPKRAPIVQGANYAEYGNLSVTNLITTNLKCTNLYSFINTSIINQNNCFIHCSSI